MTFRHALAVEPQPTRHVSSSGVRAPSPHRLGLVTAPRLVEAVLFDEPEIHQLRECTVDAPLGHPEEGCEVRFALVEFQPEGVEAADARVDEQRQAAQSQVTYHEPVHDHVPDGFGPVATSSVNLHQALAAARCADEGVALDSIDELCADYEAVPDLAPAVVQRERIVSIPCQAVHEVVADVRDLAGFLGGVRLAEGDDNRELGLAALGHLSRFPSVSRWPAEPLTRM